MEKKLNIFKSSFKIRANLKEREKEIQHYWKKIALVNQFGDRKEKFLLHSGPTYANGDIHIGHALNIILKDFALRFQALMGKESQCLPGWDMHGLPIALMVTQQQGKQKEEGGFRRECQTFANQQVTKQIKQLERIGLLINFEKQYLTLSKSYVAHQLALLAQIVAKKLVTYNFQPIYWSWASQTALAETEIEYHPIKTASFYLKFPLVKQFFDYQKVSFLVWTTTLWTIPGNQFLAVKKTGQYYLIETEKKQEKLILASKLWEKLQTAIPALKGQIKKVFQGKELLGQKYHHPYLQKESKVLAGDYVNFEEGTGIVHVAPEFGLDDFKLAQKANCSIITSINQKGEFNSKVADPDLVGKFYQKTINLIKEKISKKSNLVAQQWWNHQYPHDWRTKQPIIYLATKQLYLNLDLLKPKIEEKIEEVKWIPSWGKKRLKKILAARKNWCLSRQRSWGVPIPVFYNQKQEPVLQPVLIQKVAQLIAKHGDNIWWEWPLEQLITPIEKKQYQIVAKGKETLDVWFDAGCSAIIALEEKKIDAIWEGNDQYRGWFNSLFIINSALEKEWKIKTILTHGFVNDLAGKKMSKSKGNVVDPNQICQTWGSDVLRLWVASSNYFDDLNLGTSTFPKIGKSYLKIRNSLRFLINNLQDFSPHKELTQKITAIDHFLLLKLEFFLAKIKKHYQAYKYHLIYLELMNFITVWLSNFYFDYSKDILYTFRLDSSQRKAIQTTLYYLLTRMNIVLAPLLPHTMEEIFQVNNLEWRGSVHLQKWPEKETFFKKEENLLYQWKFLLDLKSALHKFWEKMEIKQTKTLKLKIYIDPHYPFFQNKREAENFYQENQLKESKPKKATTFRSDFNKMTFLRNVFKVYHLEFVNSPQKNKIFTGSLSYQMIDHPLCQRCHQNYQLSDKIFCQECQTILQTTTFKTKK